MINCLIYWQVLEHFQWGINSCMWLGKEIRNEENTNEKSFATLDLPKNMEMVKEDLKHVYLEALDSSQLLLLNEWWTTFYRSSAQKLLKIAYFRCLSIALIKEEIRPVKEVLEFIRSIFGNIEQELYKDLCTYVLQCGIWDKNVISSIFAGDNSLAICKLNSVL